MSTDEDQVAAASSPTTPAFVCPGSIKLRHPPIFSETDDKYFKDWIHEYDRVSKHSKLKDVHRLTVIQFYLTDVGS